MAILSNGETDYSLYGGDEICLSEPASPTLSSSAPSVTTLDTELSVVDLASLRDRSSSSASSMPPSISRNNSSDPRVSSGASDSRKGVDGGLGLERTDFLWVLNEEPHRSRRLEIMKKYPEVRQLMGHSSWTAPIVLCVVALQLSMAYYLRDTNPLSLKFIALAYFIGGTANQNLFLAIHELCHNLGSKKLWVNRALSFTANLGISVPYCIVFKKYHIEHHKHMGEDGWDTDIPSKLEGMLLNNVAGKTFFAIFQILFYALRPGFIKSQGRFTSVHAMNFAVVLASDALLVKLSGSFNPIWYLLMSSFMAGSLHPLAGHFIAEHYAFEEGGLQETYSYYGWMNWLTYNVGYHNEHHDFPNIPWTRLPALRKLAPEFYDCCESHASWPGVTWRFITDKDVGMYSRIKRAAKEDPVASEKCGKAE